MEGLQESIDDIKKSFDEMFAKMRMSNLFKHVEHEKFEK